MKHNKKIFKTQLCLNNFELRFKFDDNDEILKAIVKL